MLAEYHPSLASTTQAAGRQPWLTPAQATTRKAQREASSLDSALAATSHTLNCWQPRSHKNNHGHAFCTRLAFSLLNKSKTCTLDSSENLAAINSRPRNTLQRSGCLENAHRYPLGCFFHPVGWADRQCCHNAHPARMSNRQQLFFDLPGFLHMTGTSAVCWRAGRAAPPKIRGRALFVDDASSKQKRQLLYQICRILTQPACIELKHCALNKWH